MPRYQTLSAVCAMSLLLASGAGAEEANPLVRERILIQSGNSGGESRGSQVRVQTAINVFMPGPAGEGEAGDQFRDRARRMIYQMAARECSVLEDVFARTCRLEAINVSLTRQPGAGFGEGYMVGGNFTMVVTPK